MVALMEENEQATIDTQPRWYTAGAPYLLTRQELVDELQKRQMPVTARRVQSWVTYGLLPKPIRRLPAGYKAARGQVRALYPITTIGVIQDILTAMSVGWTIERLQQGTDERISRWDGREEEFIPAMSFDPAGSAELEQTAIQAIRAYADHIAHERGRSIMKATAEIILSDGLHQRIFVYPTLEEILG